jgi:hypothetical protein
MAGARAERQGSVRMNPIAALALTYRDKKHAEPER